MTEVKRGRKGQEEGRSCDGVLPGRWFLKQGSKSLRNHLRDPQKENEQPLLSKHPSYRLSETRGPRGTGFRSTWEECSRRQRFVPYVTAGGNAKKARSGRPA